MVRRRPVRRRARGAAVACRWVRPLPDTRWRDAPNARSRSSVCAPPSIEVVAGMGGPGGSGGNRRRNLGRRAASCERGSESNARAFITRTGEGAAAQRRRAVDGGNARAGSSSAGAAIIGAAGCRTDGQDRGTLSDGLRPTSDAAGDGQQRGGNAVCPCRAPGRASGGSASVRRCCAAAAGSRCVCGKHVRFHVASATRGPCCPNHSRLSAISRCLLDGRPGRNRAPLNGS
jgi:hypothetical protein